MATLQGDGITVPGSGITISRTAVRGVDSFGMLCSAHDIGWSDKSDGVLVVMPDDAQPGDACPAEPPKVRLSCSCVRPVRLILHTSFTLFLLCGSVALCLCIGIVPTSVQQRWTFPRLEPPSNSKYERLFLWPTSYGVATLAFLVCHTRSCACFLACIQSSFLTAVSSFLLHWLWLCWQLNDYFLLCWQIAKQPKKGKSATKDKVGKAAGFSADLDDPELEAEAEVAAAPPKKKGKKQKGSKASMGFAALSHEESAQRSDSEPDEDELASVAARKPKKGKKQTGTSSAFDVLDDGDDDTAEASGDLDEAEDAPVAAPKGGKSKKGKKKAVEASSAFAALGIDHDTADPSGDLDEAEDAPVAAPKGKSKKGKKKATDASLGFAALDVDDDVESAVITEPSVEIEEAEDEPAAAAKRKSKKGKKKAVDTSSAFAALDIDSDSEADVTAKPSDELDQAEGAPVAAPKSKSKKGKKKAVDAASAFAALGLDDDDEQTATAESAEASTSEVMVAEDAPVSAPVRKSKKSKKGAIDTASAFAALGLDDDEAEAGPHGGPADHAANEDEVFAGERHTAHAQQGVNLQS